MASAERDTDLLLRVRGTVQGVGFRPFVQRTASRLGVRGWVRNDAQGVLIRAVGPEQSVSALVQALRREAPSAARVQSVTIRVADAAAPDDRGFAIVASDASEAAVEAVVPADLALCAECRRELLDPGDRRYRYPFINCTQCGPRYSIIETLPYDRPVTTMRSFRMCPACAREYGDGDDRRFHAEPNACPHCGPRVALRDRSGSELANDDAAIRAASEALRAGRIVAVKGVGGYHLCCDATNADAVTELRRRKRRDEKPLAVMFRNLDHLRRHADVSDAAAALLASAAAPIVLVPRRAEAGLAPNVAPGNPWIGALLPYAPVHVLLLDGLPFPLIATSANLSEEPLCTANDDAHARLAQIADVFLDHDRTIAHPVDDSVVRRSTEGRIMLRRARGYAPTSLMLPGSVVGRVLCVGAQMKSAIAVAAGSHAVLSPHIGDLAGARTVDAFRGTIETLRTLGRADFTAVVHDKHPDYASTRYARETRLPATAVQHHLAHVLACVLDNDEQPDDVLGVAWDGTGYGEDGTIWGGEFILLTGDSATRFARLRPFRLAGGEAAIRDPRRTALGLLAAAEHPDLAGCARRLGYSDKDAAILQTMLGRGLNAPITSSVGRLFDGIGVLLGISGENRFEGQTPLAVEACATGAGRTASEIALPVGALAAGAGARYEVDWRPLATAVERHCVGRQPPGPLAYAFHAALAAAVVEVAERAGVRKVALTGGCFQNALLLELTATALRSAGFAVLTHRELPPNDGAIAAGQAAAVPWGISSVALP